MSFWKKRYLKTLEKLLQTEEAYKALTAKNTDEKQQDTTDDSTSTESESPGSQPKTHTKRWL